MGLLQSAISGQVPRTNHAHIVHALGLDIISGGLPSGSLLPGDAELMDRFGVSRTVLREALKTLAAKGLVVPRARIGTRVTPRASWNLFDAEILAWHFEAGIDEQFLVHISEIRLAFEPHAAEMAARRATRTDVDVLIDLAADIGRSGHTAQTHAMADLRFHLAVANASGNPFMASVGNLIEAALLGVFRLGSPTADPALIKAAAQDHLRIAEAIRDGNGGAARQAMEAVILTGVERVRRSIAGAGSGESRRRTRAV
jgi:DNA-binding FadR family transcriptional regulator